MDTIICFEVPQCSAVKVVKRFNHSAIPKLFIKFPIHSLFIFMVVCFTLFMAPMARAALVDNGNGLIYDTDLNITWYDYTKSADTWSNQKTWAAGLNVGGVTGWRLPSTVDGPWDWSFNGTTTRGSNVTTSEMGHLFYTELGNKCVYDVNGESQSGWGLTKTGPFTNLDP